MLTLVIKQRLMVQSKLRAQRCFELLPSTNDRSLTAQIAVSWKHSKKLIILTPTECLQPWRSLDPDHMAYFFDYYIV